MNGLAALSQADAVGRSVAMLLLLMSVASWVVILWKGWLLRRALADIGRGTAAFWQSPSLADASPRVAAFDREALLLPMLQVSQARPAGTLASAGEPSQQLTRLLRGALHTALHKLHYGQVLLATVGATAPFVGLLGTVWGIYHALANMAVAGQITLDQVAGPVGEALIMTAAGLAVAIPAVLAYNVMGRLIQRIEAELEGFARDLHDLLLHTPPERSQA